MELQDLVQTTEKIKREFKQNPNRSLSALFREIRTEARTSFIGDFPIMVEIVRGSVNPTRRRVYWMLRESEEYNCLSTWEKVKYYNALVYSALEVFKLP